MQRFIVRDVLKKKNAGGKCMRQAGLEPTVTDRDVRHNAAKVTVDALIDSDVFGVWL